MEDFDHHGKVFALHPGEKDGHFTACKDQRDRKRKTRRGVSLGLP